MQRRVRNLFVLILGLAAVAVAGGDPFIGTWKLDVEKSKVKSGPAALSETVTIAEGKVTVNEVTATGEAMDWSYAPSQGSAVPIDGMPNSTVVEKRIGMTVMEHTWKMNGSSLTGRAVMSKSTKTFTYTMKGVDAKGEAVEDVLIFVRQ